MGRPHMGSPDYVYRPVSEEHRQKMRDAALKRLGIPPGYCKVQGVLFKRALKEEMTIIAADMMRRHNKEYAQMVLTKIAYDIFEDMIVDGLMSGIEP